MSHSGSPSKLQQLMPGLTSWGKLSMRSILVNATSALPLVHTQSHQVKSELGMRSEEATVQYTPTVGA